MKDKFGEKNVFMAELHKDEKTPHIHFGIIPVIYDNIRHEEIVNEDIIVKNIIT